MTIKERLQAVFRDVFDDNSIDISEEMTADDIEEWDSLIHVQLILAVELEFDIRFKTAETIDLKNVGEMIVLLEKKLFNKTP